MEAVLVESVLVDAFLVEAFLMDGDDVRNYDSVATEGDEEGALALRRTAAMAVTEEIFQNFQLYSKAELRDFHFMTSVDSVEDLQQLILESGMKVGPTKCLWANEFEIQAVCEALDICCLILDMNTKDPTPQAST